jgi:hypothetical protein
MREKKQRWQKKLNFSYKSLEFQINFFVLRWQKCIFNLFINKTLFWNVSTYPRILMISCTSRCSISESTHFLLAIQNWWEISVAFIRKASNLRNFWNDSPSILSPYRIHSNQTCHRFSISLAWSISHQPFANPNHQKLHPKRILYSSIQETFASFPSVVFSAFSCRFPFTFVLLEHDALHWGKKSGSKKTRKKMRDEGSYECVGDAFRVFLLFPCENRVFVVKLSCR